MASFSALRSVIMMVVVGPDCAPIGMAPSAKFTPLSAQRVKGFSGTKAMHSLGVVSLLTSGKVPLAAPLRWRAESWAAGN